jgi:hypothetical protein
MVSETFPVSAINWLENTARSWYDAGWIDVRRRFDHGLTFLANYTYAKSLTDAPDFRSPMDEAAIPQDNSNLFAEKGLACDLRHRVTASAVYKPTGVAKRGRRPGRHIQLEPCHYPSVFHRLPVHHLRLWRHSQRRHTARRESGAARMSPGHRCFRRERALPASGSILLRLVRLRLTRSATPAATPSKVLPCNSSTLP